MARAPHEPQNGSDHPPHNGNKGKHVAIALFIATTFGIMAILSFPLSRVVRLPIRLPHPIEAALNPIERVIRPVIPRLRRPSGPRPPTVSVALAPQRPRVAPAAPSGPSGPGGPGPAPAPSPSEPPPGGKSHEPGNLSDTATPPIALATTILEQLRSTLLGRPGTLSPAEAASIEAEFSVLRSMRAACLADRPCARQLKLVEKLLHKLEAHQRGRHQGKHRHPTHKHGTANASSHSSHGTSHGRGRGHGRRHKLEGNGQESSGHSHKRHGTPGKHKKHHKG